MTRILLISFMIQSIFSFSQPNCNIYRINGDEPCYQACIMAIEAERYQGSREGQMKFDEALQLCPKLDYAYVEKSAPYLKVGNFIEWRKLIDKAVEIDPAGHLGYRGWCRYQFLRDYQGALEDFEMLEVINRFDLGYSQNGDYHLNVVKALCYKGLGEIDKAIGIIEKQLSAESYSPMPYDYLHLGVLKMEVGDKIGAIGHLNKSIAYNDYFAEPYYYLGLIYKSQNMPKEFKENMEKAKSYYLRGYRRFDPYTNPMDKIYLADIEKELNDGE